MGTSNIGFVSINQLQCSPFITLCLRFKRMDYVISESCYKGTILCKKL